MMKRIISFIALWLLVSIITFNVFSQENLISENRTYLFNYFGYDSYEIIGKVHLGEVDAILVAHYVDEEKKIADRAIVCSFDGLQIRNYLYINPDNIQDDSGEYLLNTKLNAYGWRIKVMDSRKGKIGLVFYSNNGDNITDGPRLIWSLETGKYIQFRIDTSQY